MVIYWSPSTQENNRGVGSYGTEEQRMNELCSKVMYYVNQGGGNFTQYRNNQAWDLKTVVNDSNSKVVDLHIALHSNAGGGKGTECYYYYKTAQDGKRLATILYNQVAPKTISSDRGVMPDNKLYSNGLYETRETNAPAALIEIMFHDNIVDVNDYLAKIDEIALAIAQVPYIFYDIPYKMATSEKNKAIAKLRKVSQYSDKVWVPEFEILEKKGLNIWGLINIL